MMKRIFLFILTNILVMVTISIILSLLGVQPYLNAQGINYESLMVFCAIWGVGGSFISLLLSKFMAKRMMGVRVIDPSSLDARDRDVVAMVHQLARAAGLTKMPEVGIYESPEVNAFATGPSRSSALVAVSSGLLQRMDRREIEGVLGHELAHIANGDMVTMTLIQGVMNAFVMFFARIAAFAISNALRGNNEKSSYGVQFALVMLFDIVFGLLGSMVVFYFSRHREFRADQGGAKFAGREKMIGALEALRRNTQLVDTHQPALQTLKISGAPKGLMSLLSTHPPLEKRIERLRQSI